MQERVKKPRLPVKPHEILWIGGGRRLRVLEIAPCDEKDSPFAGVLTVERTGN